MPDYAYDGAPNQCPDCETELESTDRDEVPYQCRECAGYYTTYDGWVSESEIQDVLQTLRRHAAHEYEQSPTATSVSEDAPQAVHDLREALTHEAALAIPKHTDLDPDEQSELLRRLTISIHKTTEHYLRSDTPPES